MHRTSFYTSLPYTTKISIYHHLHRHPTQCIPHIEKLWTGSEERRTTAIHIHKGERDQKSPPARDYRAISGHVKPNEYYNYYYYFYF